ncbi:MAG: hypothetical protein VCD00_08820 [Candidatus Hydrogenedentota bacterium]
MQVTLFSKPLIRKTAIFLGVAIIFLAFCLLLGPSHQTNIRYVAWKWGYGELEPDYALRFFAVDVKFRMGLYGKSKVEFEEFFPILKSPDLANDYQESYHEHMKIGDFYWMGETAWVVEFEDGVVSEIYPMKG